MKHIAIALVTPRLPDDEDCYIDGEIELLADMASDAASEGDPGSLAFAITMSRTAISCHTGNGASF